MNPHGNAAAYRPVHRREDGTHVGYLLVDGCAPPCVIPCDLLGIPLGTTEDAEAGAALLARDGLAAMQDAFEALLPRPLTEDVDPHAAAADWVWRRMVVVEVGPARATLRPEAPDPAERGRTVEIPLPADDLLHRARSA